MDPFSFEDGINYMLQSPLLFSNNFDGDDNASYHSINENIFQSPNINPNYNTDYNYNYEDETNFKTAPLLKNFLKDNKSDFFSLDIIKDFLNALIENKPLNDSNKKLINDSKEIIEKIISIKEEEKSMLLGKNININDDKKKDDEKEEKKEGGNNYLKKKRGRPTCEKGLGKHDKYKSDNIMKKNKILLINASLKFMNSFLDKDKLKKIKHKLINSLNKKKNLELLEKPLKDIFSLDISTKYTSKQNNFNANLINKIFSKNNDEKNCDKTIKFLFNITLNDFIDFYTFKIDISSLAEKYKAKVNCIKIGKNFNRVEHLLKDISKKKKNIYYN